MNKYAAFIILVAEIKKKTVENKIRILCLQITLKPVKYLISL